MRLKVGDKVRIINDRENLGVKNKIGIIKGDDKDCKPYRVYFEDIDDFFWFYEDQLELVYNKKPTKQELLEMPAGTKIYTDAEEDNEYVKKGDCNFESRDFTILCEEINDNLTLDTENDEDYGSKIIKIEKPTYETVYDESTEVQEMTVAEIEKALGHAVKIIKEDN